MRAVGLRWTFLAVLLPCLLGLLLSLAAFYRLEKAETEKGALQLVCSSSARVDGALLGAQHALQGLAATSSELDRMDMRAFRQQALQFMAASGYGNAIVLIDRDGQQLMNTLLPYASPLPKTGNRAATDHVFAHGQPYISSLFNGAVARRPLLSISVPVIRDGKVRYNLTMGMNAEALAPFVSAQLLPAGWGLVIYDRSGVIAARTRSPEKLIGHKVIPALLDRLHGPDEGLINSVSLDGEAIVGAYHRSGQTGYAVAVGVPKSVLNAPLYRKLFFPALVLLSIGLLSMLLLRRVTTRMQSSLHAFTLAIDAASQQQADCHVPANGPAEFVRLANRFNHMQDLQRAAELTLREVEHFAGIGRWEWDLASNRHVWSHELYHIYDHPPASPALAYPELLRCFGTDGAVQIAAHIEHCLASGTPFQCDVPLQHSDGMPRWVFMTGSAQRDAQGNIIKLQGLVQDISARKQTERVLARLNRAMHLVSECNDELVRAADEAALLASICRLVVDTGGYLMAWIGVALDDAAQSIRPVAQSGVEHGYLESIRISWGDNPLGQGPTGMAYRLRSTQTNQNCLTNPKMAPWREAALRCGYQASIALPLLAGDSLHGILTIYAREPDAFQHDEVALLEQLANDLAYGIAALRNEEHRKQAVAQQQASEQRYRTVLDNAADAVMITSGDGRITYANHEAAKLLGYPPEQLRDMTLADLTPAGERQKAQGIPAQLADSHQLRLEMTLQSVDDTQIPVEINAVALPDGHVYAACRDITERKQFEAELEYSATHDTLTGLANRHLLHDRIAQAMARARREQYSVALMLLDLDRFKTINDTLNHDAGDSLLREVAQRLQQQVRDGDTVARLGGDEFMVVMGDISSDDDAALLAERLLASIRQPLLAAGHHLVVTGSLGISLYPRDGDSVDELIKNADVAMYRAKALGRDEFQFYAPDMNTRMLGRLELENSLRQALQNNELTLHYQAKANIADNRIDGAEALIRWHRPGHGMVSPAQFIPLAEETGLILAIGSWVIREACRQLQQWQQQGLPPVSVAINLSARQFQQKGLAAMVAQQIADHGLHPGVIELEITESALMVDPEQAQHILQELHQTGIRIALDDFGTGYSSLNYLKRFPVDILKIDQSFVRDMNTDPQDVAIARMVIELGHALGMSVVAEGVETEQQRARLQQLGCDVMQGYLFSKPLPAAQFAALLAGATASV